METRTRFVFLMHPKEFKQVKAATGRLTHLCLSRSELHMGIGFDDHAEVQPLIRDPANFPVLLFPGREAVNLTDLAAEQAAVFSERIQGRRLVVFVLDATWALSRKMLRLSPTLLRLPRIMFTPSAPSRYLIKQQPHPGCLSTLEATHELLLALEHAGLDRYPLPDQLIGLFHRMQDLQIRFAADTERPGYRRRPYKPVAERLAPKGKSGLRRTRVFQAPE